jgi:hypothetical protein
MATRDVLEALAAAAGRQSAIGGLMFQDAQKREAQGYELALQKEKWRRSGEATALKNAREAWKFKAEKHYSQASKFYTSYVNAKRGVGVGGEFDLYGGEAKYSEEDIAEFKRNYEEAIREGNRAMKHFMRYSGIEEEYTPVPIEDLDKIPAGTGTAKSRSNLEQEAQNIVKALTKDSPDTLHTIGRQIEEDEGGESLTTLVDTINHQRETAHMDKRVAAKLERRPDDQAELDKTHLSPKEEVKVRKLLAKLITDEVAMTRTEEYKRPIPRVFDPTGQTFSQLDQNVRRDEVIASGFGDEIESQAGYNQAIASEAQRTAPKGAAIDPAVIAAEQVAADRAAQAAAEQAAAEKRQGIISSTEYKRAYSDAQKIITQMAQSGYLSYDAFEKFIAEQSLHGIEMMAYRQAFKDAAAKSGSSRFSIGEDPYSFGGPLDHRSWWENTKRGTRTMLDNFR